MKEHDFAGALKAFDEILTLLTTNQRGIIQFLEDDVRHALTLAKKMQDEGLVLCERINLCGPPFVKYQAAQIMEKKNDH